MTAVYLLVALAFAALAPEAARAQATPCPCQPGETNVGFANFNGCPGGGDEPPVTVCTGANDDEVIVDCENGAFEVTYDPAPPGGPVDHIGRCAYDWGENHGECCIDNITGNITHVCWWNQEGHTAHGRDPGNPLNGHVHDDTAHGQCDGEYEMDCYSYDVATRDLEVVKWKRPIDMVTWLEQECWQDPETIYEGTAPSSHSSLVSLTMHANSGSDGQDNTGNYVWAQLSGTANPGSITLRVRDEVFHLSLSGGETSDAIALSLASMVNGNSSLVSQGVDAFVFLEGGGDPTQLNIGRVQERQRSISQQGQGQQQGGIEITVPWEPSQIPAIGELGLGLVGVMLMSAAALLWRARRTA